MQPDRKVNEKSTVAAYREGQSKGAQNALDPIKDASGNDAPQPWESGVVKTPKSGPKPDGESEAS